MKSNCSKLLSALLLSLPLISQPLTAQSPSGTVGETSAQRDARMGWWRDARFGMFVHWGLYSGLAGAWDGKSIGTKGGMEWIQKFVKADTDSYAAQALPLFRPKPGFAREWMKLAKEAGCKYVVFTTKHHEGFGLFSSKAGDYNAGAKLDRDLAKEIVDAARTEGLRVGFYHSLIDWHHDQYDYTAAQGLPYPVSGPLANAPRDHSKYIDYLHTQVRELLTNYGQVDILWWDFSSKGFEGDKAWRATDLAKMVRSLQPGIIMNNRLFNASTTQAASDEHKLFDPGKGDFITPEQRIPATGMGDIDWETCMTLNTTWGYSDFDHDWKSGRTLIRNLVDISSKGGNYLLNIGPKGDGSLTPETVALMQSIGKWMKVNSESIYGTKASPFPSLPWGRATRKGDALYLQVFDWPADGTLEVPLKNKLLEASLLASPDVTVSGVSDADGLKLTLPKEAPDGDVSVIKIRIAGEPDLVPQPSTEGR